MALTDDLISYWELDEASGTRADAHDDNDLTDNNTVTSATGKVGDAADFERDNSEFLSIADNADVSTGDIDFTWALWVRPETLPAAAMAVLSKDNGSVWEYEIYISSTGAVRFYVENGGSSEEVTTPDITASNGTWLFIVAWHDATNNQLAIQVDNGTPVAESYAGGVADTDNGLYFGAESGGVYFDGLIDQVGFWKRVLTTDERTALYNSGNGLSYAALSAYGDGTIAPRQGLTLVRRRLSKRLRRSA